MDGYLRDIKRATRSLEEARVVEDDEGGFYELEDGTVHVHVELSRGGERTYADLNMALGGSSAGMVRLPKVGDTCLVAIPGEGVGRAHVLGWTSSPSGMPAPQELEEDLYLLRAAEGEDVLVKTSGGNITLATSKASIEVSDSGQITHTSGDIRLGSSSASDPVTLESKVTANQTASKAWQDAHVHLYVAPLIPLPSAPVPTTPAAAAPTGPAPAPKPNGATKIKGE